MKFSYTRPPGLPDNIAGMPFVRINLYYAGREITWPALVDSGSTTSILPYDVGLQLGLVWGEYTQPVILGGIYKNVQACSVLLRGEIPGLPETGLGFAWIEKPSSEARLLLGQTNFFQRFKVTFEAYKDTFDISPKNDVIT